MSQNPIISVIMPVHNTKETYLKRSIDSVLNQSFDNFELIIVNSSTDDTEEFILSYEDTRIKHIVQTKGGQSKARNAGLRYAKGKYVFFIDADDTIEIKALEKTFQRAEQLNSDILLFATTAHDEATNKYSIWLDELNFYSDESICYKYPSPEVINSLFYINQACWGKLFKTSFLIDNNLFFIEGLIFEDLEFMFRYMLKANRIGVLKESLYNYNQNVDNSSCTNGDERHFDIIKVFELLEETFTKYDLFKHYRIKFYDFKLLMYNHWYQRIRPDIKDKFKEIIITDLKTTKMHKQELEKLVYKNEIYSFLLEIIK